MKLLRLSHLRHLPRPPLLPLRSRLVTRGPNMTMELDFLKEANKRKFAETADASATVPGALTVQLGVAPPLPVGGAGGAPPPPPPQIQPQILALQRRIEELELNNQVVGNGEHAAPLNCVTSRLVVALERRVAGIEKDLGVTYRINLPNKTCETLKEGNRQFNEACKAFKGKKEDDGTPILAPPCWAFVQFQLTEAMLADPSRDGDIKKKGST